ncbi:GntR family transcriptional regulator [Gilliamella sp. wkB108]|uniref:GntR family transcriptional regulator n=1 Tax=Gilliamella sp. wkB108 TaxID=3120256 RepID=UPI00080E648C|nr:GntR family transcriptional regulator [Gilliamella apicola]OCG24216.1 GntR family transcriptional regulator [Gilliamella apicola]
MIYIKIANELKVRINDDSFKIGDTLPSEKVLAKEFNVSIMTIRKALAILQQEMIIVKKHGSGSYIQKKMNFSGGELDGFKKQMDDIGCQNYQNKVIDFRIISCPFNIANHLKIAADEKIYFVKRLRLINNSPVLIEDSYIPVNLFPYLSVGHLEKSKFSYFKENCNIEITKSLRWFTPAIATTEQVDLLKIERNSLLLRIQSINYSQHNKIVELSVIHQDTNKYNVKRYVERR